MTLQIVEKLQSEIRSGLKKEAQVVYVLAGIRKILEQENTPAEKYFYLRFHCDWVLHSKLDRKPAQYVLSQFSSAHLQLLKGETLTSNEEADRLSKMDQFREELSDFFRVHSIADFPSAPDSWTRFLYLYSRVIEDVPLLIRSGSSVAIKQIAVSVEVAKKSVSGHRLFKVSWRISDRDGRSGTIFVLNSFEDRRQKKMVIFRPKAKKRKGPR